MDSSLVIAHCNKELAAGTFKGTGGRHPLEAWCDNTGESLALLPRKGSAGSNTATDHLTVLNDAITQIPARYRRDQLVTVDGAGASHGLVDHITTPNASPRRTVHYSIGWELAARERGCRTTEQREDGTLRYRITGRHFKGVTDEHGNTIPDGEVRS